MNEFVGQYPDIPEDKQDVLRAGIPLFQMVFPRTMWQDRTIMGTYDVAVASRTDEDLTVVNRAYRVDWLTSFAAKLARRPASAVELSKRLLYDLDGLSFEEGIARGAEVNVMARRTEECREGVRRFLDGMRES